MKNFGAALKLSMTYVGTLIGAGFASGREIALFFGSGNIFNVIIAGLLLGFFAYVFLELGRTTTTDITRELFPKTYRVFDVFVSGVNLVIFCAMLAGAELAVRALLNLNGGGLITGLVAVAIVGTNMEGLKIFNVLTTPLIIIFVVTLFILSPDISFAGEVNIVSPLLYSAFNVLTGGFLIARMGKGISKGISVATAAIITVILTFLLCVVYLLVKNYMTADMPIVQIASALRIGKIASVVIFVAILGTMAGTLAVASRGNTRHAVVITAIGFVVSLLGFSNIVNITYPVIGIFGIFLSLFATLKLLFRRKNAIKHTI
jgi:uncharacterized membrane protein YkvI